MKPAKNTLTLDMRCEEEGRVLVEIDIGLLLLPAERKWLFDLLDGTHKGRQIQFGVDSTPAGEQVIKFTLAAPVAASHEPQESHAASAAH